MKYYVKPDGSYGVTTDLTADALEISSDIYNLIHSNEGLVGFEIEGNVVHIKPRLEKYRESATALIDRKLDTLRTSLDAVHRDHLILTYGRLDKVEAEALRNSLQKQVLHYQEQTNRYSEMKRLLASSTSFREMDGILTLGGDDERQRHYEQ